MKKCLEKLIGIELPTADYIVQQKLGKLSQLQEQASPSEPVESLPKHALAQVKVVLFRDNNCSIIIEIEDGAKTEQEAAAIARMLFQLNEGGMKSTIASIMLRQTTGNINDTDFGKSIMQAWEKQYKEQDEDSILPSRVFEPGQ